MLTPAEVELADSEVDVDDPVWLQWVAALLTAGLAVTVVLSVVVQAIMKV